MLRVPLLIVLASLIGCGAPKGGTLAVDTPALPYKAPDIEELSGVEDEPEVPAEEPKEEPKPAPSAETAPPPPSPVVATPAPAKPAAKPAAKPGTPAAPAKK